MGLSEQDVLQIAGVPLFGEIRIDSLPTQARLLPPRLRNLGAEQL